MRPRQSVSGGSRPKRGLPTSPDAGKFPTLRFGVLKAEPRRPVSPRCFVRARQSVSGGERPERGLSASPDAGKFPNLRFGVFSWRSLIKDDSSLPLLPSAFGRRAVRNGSDPPTRSGFHYTIRTKGFQFFSVLPPVFSTDSARFPDSKKAAFSGCFFFFGKELPFFSLSFQESSLCCFGSLSARSSSSSASMVFSPIE